MVLVTQLMMTKLHDISNVVNLSYKVVREISSQFSIRDMMRKFVYRRSLLMKELMNDTIQGFLVLATLDDEIVAF